MLQRAAIQTEQTTGAEDPVTALRRGVARPFEDARSMPPSVYTSPGFLALEQEHVFRRQWICVGRASTLAKRGDFPHLTIAENIAFPLSVRRVGKADQARRVRRALEMVELPHVAERRPAQLSGGQQQRVALARALVFEPRLVLMDEPLGALDKRLRETMQYEIKRLHRQLDVTIVYVTHDQGEALTMSDRVAVFFDGRIQQIAAPNELYEDAQNAFVANFIGENNGLSGRVCAVERDWATIALAGGGTVRGKAGLGLTIGQQAVLALRPERALVAPDAADDINRVTGRVEDIIYCGDHHRVQISLGDARDFVIKVPNTQDHALPPIGDRIDIGWRAGDCKILGPA